MIKNSISKLEFICETIPDKLFKLEERLFNEKISPNKWSKKEILGHLIDSATNNHHRFVKGQYEILPKISYDQNKWNELNFYQLTEKNQLIDFWTLYNKHLLIIFKNIKSENLKNEINTGGIENCTIEFLINDYIEHLEHHLNQIIEL
jgi:hypothetical protein